jgi:eukaryotic-like serine/threonine-protein kinase
MPTPSGYVIDHVVGHGGSATVFRAHRRDDPDFPVALKVLDDDHHRHRGPLDRLQREFDTANRLVHDHIVSMYECGSGWLAMQLVHGGTARRLPDTGAVLATIAHIADALDYTHRQGIVHCDVKPSNILVHQDFSARGAVLIDFGVSHMMAHDVRHRPDDVESSLPYTAPELLRGHNPSAATDEYALACTVIELLTGSTPFVASTAMGLAHAQLYSPVPSFSQHIAAIPRAFDSVVTKAMAKDPDNRYSTCTEFIKLVTRVLLDGR